MHGLRHPPRPHPTGLIRYPVRGRPQGQSPSLPQRGQMLTQSIHPRFTQGPAFVAQGIEHRSPKAGVAGSNPAGGTTALSR
jgi:hypothetical protein